MGLPVTRIDEQRHTWAESDRLVVEGTFSGIGGCIYILLAGPEDDEGVEMDGDGFLMYVKKLSQGRFREVLKKGDDGVRRLHWDDFYMLMRGLTPVKVMVEQRFRMATK